MSLEDIDNLSEDIVEKQEGHIDDHKKIVRGLKSVKEDKISKGDLFFSPYDFGATGNGISNDTSALQQAYDSAVLAGGAVVIPKGIFNFTTLNMTNPGVSLIGIGGILKNGTVTVGTATAQDFSGTSISGIFFDGGEIYSLTKKSIIIKNTRGLDIKNNRFADTGKAISVTTADGATGFHTVSMINIQGNRFKGVDFGIYAETQEWDVCSDWSIVDNYFNFASTTSVYMTGVDNAGVGGSDGLIFSRNTIFGLNYSQVGTSLYNRKKYNLYLGKTNFLHISDNNFFEAGYSSVRCDTAKNILVTGNHFAWGGQLQQGDALEFRGGELRGVIQDNTFEDWTRSAIGFYDSADLKRIEIATNVYKWQSAPTSWKGTGTLSSTNCFRVFSDTTCVGNPVV